MKKVFLFFGIAALTGAAAQNKDLLDINKHLEKKINLTNGKGLFTQKMHKTSGIEINKSVQVFTLPNGDRVLSSPKYNMPVVIPGNSYVYNMPTRFVPSYRDSLSKLPGRIPNGSIEFKMSIIR